MGSCASSVVKNISTFYPCDVMEPIKLPWMSESEINDLIDSQTICRIALKGSDYPYLAPFQYIRLADVLYFHFTDYGIKMRFLQENRKACVQIEYYEPDLSSYKFVSLRGELEQVKDLDKYEKAVKMFAEIGKKRLSPKFLAAHGLDPDGDWDSFNVSKQFVIMKLVNVTDKIGLKSP